MYTLVVGYRNRPSAHYQHESSDALAVAAGVLARNDDDIDMLLIFDKNQNVMNSMVREGVDNWKTAQYTVNRTSTTAHN